MNKPLISYVDRLLFLIIIITYSGMVLISFANIIGRYLFNSPLWWGEELSRFLSIWLVFIALRYTTRSKMHLASDGLIKKFSVKVQRTANFISFILTTILLVVMLWAGIKMVFITHMQNSASLRIPMSFVFIAIPIGCLLMLIEILIQFYNEFLAKR